MFSWLKKKLTTGEPTWPSRVAGSILGFFGGGIGGGISGAIQGAFAGVAGYFGVMAEAFKQGYWPLGVAMFCGIFAGGPIYTGIAGAGIGGIWGGFKGMAYGSIDGVENGLFLTLGGFRPLGKSLFTPLVNPDNEPGALGYYGDTVEKLYSERPAPAPRERTASEPTTIQVSPSQPVTPSGSSSLFGQVQVHPTLLIPASDTPKDEKKDEKKEEKKDEKKSDQKDEKTLDEKNKPKAPAPQTEPKPSQQLQQQQPQPQQPAPSVPHQQPLESKAPSKWTQKFKGLVTAKRKLQPPKKAPIAITPPVTLTENPLVEVKKESAVKKTFRESKPHIEATLTKFKKDLTLRDDHFEYTNKRERNSLSTKMGITKPPEPVAIKVYADKVTTNTINAPALEKSFQFYRAMHGDTKIPAIKLRADVTETQKLQVIAAYKKIYNIPDSVDAAQLEKLFQKPPTVESPKTKAPTQTPSEEKTPTLQSPRHQ